jgi:hypothetical protein
MIYAHADSALRARCWLRKEGVIVDRGVRTDICITGHREDGRSVKDRLYSRRPTVHQVGFFRPPTGGHMLKLKKGLANILENNNEREASQPQPPQSVRTAPKLNEPEEAPPQPSQTPQQTQPPASAPRQMGDQMGWEEHLIQALAKAPDDVAQKLISCIDREVLLKVLGKRNDPILRVALLLLKK